MGQAFSRKVQLTREEFLRELPDAAGRMSYHTDGDDIIMKDNSQTVRITLTDLGVKDLGALHLPMQQVDFSFENMAPADIEGFMTRWDDHKLRMGG